MINVGIADDHAIVRLSLKQLLAAYVDLRVVGEASNGREAIDLAQTVSLDVLVMDLSMPGQNGLDAVSRIRAKAPDLGILILSGHDEAQYAMPLLRQGVGGYLNKSCEPAIIVDAVRKISLGGRYITPTIAEMMARQVRRHHGSCPAHELLSDREFQVFIRLAKGDSTSDVARALSLSAKTISTHRTRLKDKLGLSSSSDLTYYALMSKLID